MIRVAPPVLLFHTDQPFVERVRRACTGRYLLHRVTSWGALRQQLEAAPSTALVILDPWERAGGGVQLSNSLRTLLREFPSAIVLAACELRRGSMEEVRTLGEWGVTRIICLDEEDTALAVGRALQTSQGRPLRKLLHRALPVSASGRARALVMAAADVVASGGLGSDLARAMHITPRTLQRWCLRAGLPAPRQLLAWMRLLLAAELLDDPGRPVAGVALACGYSSDGALRNAFRAYFSMGPSALRRLGAFDVVSSAFLDTLVRPGTSARANSGFAGSMDGSRVIPLRGRSPDWGGPAAASSDTHLSEARKA